MNTTVKNIEDWRDTVLKAETMEAFRIVYQMGRDNKEFPESIVENITNHLIK